MQAYPFTLTHNLPSDVIYIKIIVQIVVWGNCAKSISLNATTNGYMVSHSRKLHGIQFTNMGVVTRHSGGQPRNISMTIKENLS